MKRIVVAARYEPIFRPLADHMPNLSISPKGITISCYENDIPAFVDVEMNRIYGSLYASLAQFRVYSDGRDTSTYIVRKAGRAITVFLFQHHGGNVQVVNQVIKVDEEDISRFAAYIFASFESAKVISFKAIQTNLRKIPFCYQRSNYREDIVLNLPDTEEEYIARLDGNTRRNIHHYAKKLLHSFPTICFDVFAKDEIDEQTIRDIINLNRARMADKNKISTIDEDETLRIIRLATECGFVGVIRIDGRVCAGSISFSAGSNYFFSVIAHDPLYDDYCLGILCCYSTICECIARDGKEFHFQWGECKYKYTLLGIKRDLDNVAIFRSRVQMLRNIEMVLTAACWGYVRQLMSWLHNKKHNSRKKFLPLQAFQKLNCL
ncbi:MAG: GNAT family N-acetyltransferase [Burkholderiaceae bacterium]